MNPVVVVGSGASGVHFAQSALQKGHRVLMLDVGRKKPPTVAPGFRFDDLKHQLSDPAEYFLGQQYEAVTFPGSEHEVYAFPPNKRYVFAGVENALTSSHGIDPLESFARGGLAEAWTAGVYPFNDSELADFPFTYAELAPYYGAVAERIGINGVADDLARFFPVHDNLLEPLELDRHSHALLQAYEQRREKLNQRLGFHLGRSRIATLTRPQEERQSCSYCGRCMWGCPTDAFYTPSLTLDACLKHPNFEYRSDFFVEYFKVGPDRAVSSVVGRSTTAGERVELAVDRLVLAAGTLSSARIFLDSLHRATGRIARLSGLMDNRQILVPYVNLRLVGSAYETSSYQYHQIAVGLEGQEPRSYVHGQVTTLTTGLVHPVIESLPLDLGTGVRVFRTIRAALGVVNVNLHDTRRAENYVTIEPARGNSPAHLIVQYAPTADEPARVKIVLQRLRRALWRLGCVAPSSMVHVRPMGAGVHYSGTLPMSRERTPLTVSPKCESHDFGNVFLADGSTFPFLPAKNVTFTLMANAARVAELMQ